MSIIALPNNDNNHEEEEINDEDDKKIAKIDSSQSSLWIVNACKFIYDLPFTSIVRYVYKHEPLILFTVITSNWIIPPTVELIAPWWLVPDSIVSEIKILQSDLNQQLNMIDLSTISINMIYKIVGLTLYCSTLRTCARYITGRINLRLRHLMRRLIMEKIIYSEIDSLQNAYHEALGYRIDQRVLERTMMRDLNSSISVIFEQIPSTFTHSSRFFKNAYKLYLKRDKLDFILIIYPFLYQFTREIIGALTTWDINDKLTFKQRRSKQLMSKLIQNTVIGLEEIQIMNYSEYQLSKLDVLMNEYFQSKFSRNALFMDIIDDLRNHSILRWLFETLLEIKIRSNRYNDPNLTGISHKEYNKMKSECNSLYNSLTKLYSSINNIRRNINRQLYLKQILYLPGFKNEEEELKKLRGFHKTVHFQYIEFKYIYFKYKENYSTDSKKKENDLKKTEDIEINKKMIDNQVEIIKNKKKLYMDKPNISTSAWSENEDGKEEKEEKQNKQKNVKCDKYEFKLLINETVKFERGKTYGICGRNESGKTTLIDILCKLRKPQYIECIINGDISYDLIPRVEIRKQISYISQKPFLFEGSIGENIHIANPNASIEDVKEAAKLGGVFLSIQSDIDSSNLSYNDIARIVKNGNKYNNGGGGGEKQRGNKGGRGGRGRRRGRKRKGGKRTIATHMVEGIVKWGKNENKDDDQDDNDGNTDNNGGILNYLMSFLKKADNKQVNKQKVNNNDNDEYDDLYGSKIKNKKKENEYDDGNLFKTDYNDKILNYEIKGNGSNVSGGLKQSISLSRIFLRKQSKIIICDESFNSMDMVKKNTYIYPALFEFIKKYNITLILISHDILECFKDLNHILILENGIIHKQGTHKYLFNNSILYRKLCGQK